MSNCDRRPHLMVLQVPHQDGHLLVAAFLWGYDGAVVWGVGSHPASISEHLLPSEHIRPGSINVSSGSLTRRVECFQPINPLGPLM